MGSPSHQSLTGVLLGGRFRLGRELGRGGMGAVYEAVQENIGRRVAIKIVLQDLAEDSEVLARFRREAEAAASLGHPNIVQVTDFQHRPGEPAFLVMEYLAGESLRARLQREGTIDAGTLVSIAMQVLAALGAAHGAGIVHRDLKPDNVFLVEMPGLGSLAKLLDFGIAKLTESKGYTRLTATGMMIGTPAYMAPEQMSGGTVDARTDLYSLAVMMYRSLVGRPPFAGNSPAHILKAIMDGAAIPLATLRPDLDPRLAHALTTAMSPVPEARFPSADVMRSALAPLVVSSTAPPAIATPSPASFQTPTRRVAADANAGPTAIVKSPSATATGASIVAQTSLGEDAPRASFAPSPPPQFGVSHPPNPPSATQVGFASAASSIPHGAPVPGAGELTSFTNASPAMLHALPNPSATAMHGTPQVDAGNSPLPPRVSPKPTVPSSASLPPERRRAVIALAIGGGAFAVSIAAALGVWWLADSPADSGNARASVAGMAVPATTPDQDPGAAVGMPSLGALVPAAAVGPLRMNVVGVYAAQYSSLASMEPSIRVAAANALGCLVSTGYIANGTIPLVWGISVDASGQSIGSTAADPGGDQRVTNCLISAGQAAQFAPPAGATATAFGVRVQIVANE